MLTNVQSNRYFYSKIWLIKCLDCLRMLRDSWFERMMKHTQLTCSLMRKWSQKFVKSKFKKKTMMSSKLATNLLLFIEKKMFMHFSKYKRSQHNQHSHVGALWKYGEIIQLNHPCASRMRLFWLNHPEGFYFNMDWYKPHSAISLFSFPGCMQL